MKKRRTKEEKKYGGKGKWRRLEECRKEERGRTARKDQERRLEEIELFTARIFIWAVGIMVSIGTRAVLTDTLVYT